MTEKALKVERRCPIINPWLRSRCVLAEGHCGKHLCKVIVDTYFGEEEDMGAIIQRKASRELDTLKVDVRVTLAIVLLLAIMVLLILAAPKARAQTVLPWDTIKLCWDPATTDLQGGPITAFYTNIWMSTKPDGSGIAYKTQVSAGQNCIQFDKLPVGTYCFQALTGAGYAESALSLPPYCQAISAPVVVRAAPKAPANLRRATT